MKPFLSCLLVGAAATLSNCQQTPPADQPTQAPVAVAPTPTAGLTEADARAKVATYVKTMPNPELYVTDSARVNDNGATWQVLVPRRDWARRMPNSARFEVQKETGAVSTAPVK
ncbi:hypothetical protein MUN81_13145 [Hymenobacter sp. 5317J-9]|uniref:hypothetical protein n=1 Tax=Hymenobacter sp. 5317J-9 TaxID=2932250 RepID=UPI001FD6D04A|nr:hypothetical protein [Hymenobacter sp. 5317J-9]UOQ96198.1 hypothetical protein MUN81_13145 [Hymenobacter sp. 5317J-9]